LDCYFTREELRSGETLSPFDGLKIRNTHTITSIQLLIAELHKQLPDAEVYQSKENPAVIHLIDGKLSRKKNWLNDNIELSYVGNPSGLIGALRKKGKPIVKISSVVTGPIFYMDYDTAITVHVPRSTVRRVMTDHLPLSDYHRELWCAEFFESKEGLETDVYYRNRAWRKPSLEATNFPQKLAPFSLGEIAFVDNKGKEGAVDAALAFIDERMKGDDHTQARWAMLFLGREKAERGIPKLLKYLDYRYTVCAITEEEFPGRQGSAADGRGRSPALPARTDRGADQPSAAAAMPSDSRHPGRGQGPRNFRSRDQSSR
jgi:hypothetical protein